ncbi:MAG: phosphoesterase [Chloroflexi bacterium]|nr:MAG: phosphoesterase [Chloroflexota bacterium]
MAVIEHVFVLMLENRSFDHLLGFAGLRGADGLTGAESNPLPSGERVPVARGAPYILPIDPGHEFGDVVEQLCGPGTSYAGGPYPPIDNQGFAACLADHIARTRAAADPSLAMRGFGPDQLPVLTTLAREFAVCDRWFSSMPGPTWPNRLFVHAASAAGLDDSPTSLRSVTSIVHGFEFEHGTVFDRLDRAGLSWHVVEGDALPQSLALGGMLERAVERRFIGLDDLKERLSRPGFDDAYVFIEPSYGHVLADGRNFKCGSSMHPLDDVTRGERLVKEVYEAIRSSACWPTSLLLITFDEHGGLYDHVTPPPAVAPGDTFDPDNNRHGFRFDQLGVRVPALIVSPHVPRGVVDHTVYDHTSLLATVEHLYGLEPMTRRDAAAERFDHLLSAPAQRRDTPARLPEPAVSGIRECEGGTWEERLAGDLEEMPEHLSGEVDAALVGFLHVAVARELHLAASVHRDVGRAIRDEEDRLVSAVRGVRTKFDAVRLLRDVERRYQRHREA